jgi:chlorobactene glucosyltransferase
LAILLLSLLLLIDLCWLCALAVIWAGVCKWPFAHSVEANAPPIADELPEVVVFIPARNEAPRLERALRSVLAQDYPHFRVLFVDDQSTDETLAIAQRIAKTSDRLEVVQGQQRPAGWLGKPWALHQLTHGVKAPWFLFVDSDVVLHPQAISRAVEAAEHHRADLLSFMITVELKTFWQRVVGIASGAIMAIAAPLAHVNDPKWPTSFAAGGFMLFRHSAYQKLGGHAAVRNEVVEDVALAKHVKQHGLRLVLLSAPDLLSTHFYGSLHEIWTSMRKNLYAIFGYRPLRLLAYSIGLCVWTLLPGLVLIAGLARLHPANPLMWGVQILLAVGGCAALAGMSAVIAHLTRSSVLYALIVPLGSLILLAIAWDSAFMFHFGSRVEWKGRSFDANDLLRP